MCYSLVAGRSLLVSVYFVNDDNDDDDGYPMMEKVLSRVDLLVVE